ncbi:hypothetical protein B9479_006725 [Cryptococcus floricola]|uniref:DNA ligase D 3'-phosphoesterase domain-containing protein n=1 Tax=Cryptococcus floricola TaxID=2591691 RepID=A0A5D3ASF2_9TREE|nr:hypothetical protein B9479_006725 [Cryptococcus floricola]
MWALHELAENAKSRRITPPEGPSSSASVPAKRPRSPNLDKQPTSPLAEDGRKKHKHTTRENEDEGTNHQSKPSDRYASDDDQGVPPWGFSPEIVDRFPALTKRNFWCIQRHSATALHYDLRLQLDGKTVSWAVPKGLLGMSKSGESRRMAVETTLHSIEYTIHEASSDRTFGQGRRGGTQLWDIGEYTIDYLPSTSDDGYETEKEREAEIWGVEEARSRKKDNLIRQPDGRDQEDLFRQALYRPITQGKSRSIHFSLENGRKMVNNSYILVLSSNTYGKTVISSDGKEKKTWFISLPRGVNEYPWDRGGQDGDFYGRSVKSGMTFEQVCEGRADT